MKSSFDKIVQIIFLLISVFIFINLGSVALAQSPEPESVEAALAAEDSVRVVIALHAPEISAQQIADTQEQVLEAMSEEGFELIHRYQTLPGLVAEINAAALEQLQQQPEVEAIALDFPVEAALLESKALIHADDVFNQYGLTGAGVNVAVLDSGIDLSHPDLAEMIIAQHCFNRTTCPPDGMDEGEIAQDENGHGTHVAGIIASQGQSSPLGIAPGVGLVAVRVLDSQGSGYTSDVIAGIDWVVAHQSELQVRVINLSLGGGQYEGVCDEASANTLLYAAAVERASAMDITTFAASGNSGFENGMMVPACISGVVSVGNVYDSPLDLKGWMNCVDEDVLADQVTCSSNSSSELDLLAPGVSVQSAHLGGGQISKSGTSMSTPHAAAVAALMLEADPDLTPSEIEMILKETGLPITDARNGRVTPRLDALAAVQRVIGSEFRTLSGTVHLQGRSDHSGVQIFASPMPCSLPPTGEAIATTETEGHFEITVSAAEQHCLQLVHSGYLIERPDSSQDDLGVIQLLGGDVTNNGLIDIFDLSLVASRYGSSDPIADINADGLIDIFDLSMIAGNYGLAGPSIQD